jgi:transcription elongation factor B subunit 1
MSDFTADILEVVLQYLHYKNRWQFESPVNLPKF